MVEPVRETFEHRTGHQAGQHRERRALEFLLQELRNQRCEAFRGLERHVADEAVAHDDVDLALEDVVAFDVAAEVHVAGSAHRAQQFAGTLDGFVALDFFFPDVEQADARVFLAIDR